MVKHVGVISAIVDLIAQFFAGLASEKITEVKEVEDYKNKTKK